MPVRSDLTLPEAMEVFFDSAYQCDHPEGSLDVVKIFTRDKRKRGYLREGVELRLWVGQEKVAYKRFASPKKLLKAMETSKRDDMRPFQALAAKHPQAWSAFRYEREQNW